MISKSLSAKIVGVIQVIYDMPWAPWWKDATLKERVILVIINNGNGDEWQCHWEVVGLPWGSPKQPAARQNVSRPGGCSVTETTLTFQPKTWIKPLIWRCEQLKWKKLYYLSLSLNTVSGLWDIFPDKSTGSMLPYSSNRRQKWVGQEKSQIPTRVITLNPVLFPFSTSPQTIQWKEKLQKRANLDENVLKWDHVPQDGSHSCFPSV